MDVAISSIGVVVTVAGIVWTIIGILSNRAIKRQLLNEREMLRQKVLDFRNRIKAYENVIQNDRKTKDDPTLDTAHIRVEELTTIRTDLERFAETLKTG